MPTNRNWKCKTFGTRIALQCPFWCSRKKTHLDELIHCAPDRWNCKTVKQVTHFYRTLIQRAENQMKNSWHLNVDSHETKSNINLAMKRKLVRRRAVGKPTRWSRVWSGKTKRISFDKMSRRVLRHTKNGQKRLSPTLKTNSRSFRVLLAFYD